MSSGRPRSPFDTRGAASYSAHPPGAPVEAAGPPSRPAAEIQPQRAASRTADRRGLPPTNVDHNHCPGLRRQKAEAARPRSAARDNFAALFEASISAGEFGKEGEIVKGTVVAVHARQRRSSTSAARARGSSPCRVRADGAGRRPASSPATSSTSTSRAARTTTASSRFHA